MFRTRLLAIGGAAAAALALAVPSTMTSAATPAEMIAQRQALMDLQGATATAVQSALKAGDIATAGKLAAALHSSAHVIPTFFDKGTGAEAGKTRALPVIWEKWDDFKADAAALGAAADKLVAAGKAGDTAAGNAAFAELGKACGSCHNTFRAR
ncbi:MAG TPA: cytochrome c [Alphaproteobacteria bacterium]|jgi:cytochrome c556|nr:cytochrome c [Alphaproteobacteria bacterium]